MNFFLVLFCLGPRGYQLLVIGHTYIKDGELWIKITEKKILFQTIVNIPSNLLQAIKKKLTSKGRHIKKTRFFIGRTTKRGGGKLTLPLSKKKEKIYE